MKLMFSRKKRQKTGRYLCLSIILSLALTLLCYPPILGATEPAIHFRHLSVEQGLSQSTVYAIVQDNKGFMWFATQDGLNRYDGYEFKLFRHDPQDPASLSHNYIWSIHQDLKGELWIGTRGGGLNHFNPQTQIFIHFKHKESDPYSLSNDDVRAIHEDSKGNLWVATYGGGLNRFNRQTRRFERFKHHDADPGSLSDNKVMTLMEDSKGALWVGTDGGGLDRFNRQNGDFDHFRHRPGDLRSLSHNSVYAIHESHQGILWIGTRGGGLNRFDSQNNQFSHFIHDPAKPDSLSHNMILTIDQDSQGLLWLGTDGGGLNRFDPGQQRFTNYRHSASDPHGLGSDRIWSIHEDRNRVLWIGSRGGGLSTYNPRAERFGHIKQQTANMSHNIIVSFAEDRAGMLWIGTLGAGLKRFDRQTGQFKQFRHHSNDPHSLSHDIVTAILADSRGALWLGTLGGGLNRFDAPSGRFEHFVQHRADDRHSADPHSLSHNGILSMTEDSKGILWIGTRGGGLNKFDPRSGRFEHFRHQPSVPGSLAHDVVWTVIEDSKGSLWVGTDNGLNRYQPQTKSFKTFRYQPANSRSLSYNIVKTIFEDSGGTLWIGTGSGLNRFDASSESFIRYAKKDGLGNEFIYGILEDSHHQLWLSTNHGLSRFDPQSQTFRNYDVNDGLQSNEFNTGAYFKSAAGELFFGGINGFNRFFPETIEDNRQIPKVVLTDFLLNNRSVPIRSLINAQKEKHDKAAFALDGTIDSLQQLTLDHHQNLISFEFAALDFANPMKNRYAYQLQGIDQKWIFTDSKNRRASYTNIAPGDHILRIKASNSDGYWNEQGKSLNIRILPPPWRSWWAYLLYVLLSAGLAFVVIRTQSRKAHHEHAVNQHLETQVAERTSKLVQAEKMASLGSLTAGVAHGINNPASFVHVSAQNLGADMDHFKHFLFQLAGSDADGAILDSFQQQFSPLYEHLKTIQNGTERIKIIVEDLKTFTQPDAAGQKNVCITDLLLSTVHLVQTKHLEFTRFVIDFNTSVELHCNPAQLNQVFMNLIINACDAIGEKQRQVSRQQQGQQEQQEQQKTRTQGVITIGCRMVDSIAVKGSIERSDEKKLKQQLEITVRDNGCGMTAETQKKLFEPFYTTKNIGEGTGLGLSISFGIVQKHQGELSVESEPGIGSMFRLRLPVG